jgi:heat shock protein HslJ
MMRMLPVLGVLLAGCAAAVDAPMAAGPDMALESIDGAAFGGRATIAFGPGDTIGGFGPCNRWSGALLAPLPAFRTGGIVSTEMACDDLAAEGVFLAALATMTQADVTPEAVVLSGPNGRSMVFRVQG